jgi:hypothetical protein
MDLRRVRPVFEESGPFVTVHVEVGRANENPEGQMEARWTHVRHELEHLGTAEQLVEDIGGRVTENHHQSGDVRRTIVASDSKVLLDELQVGHSVAPEIVDHGALPDLSGWLVTEDQSVPFVLAVVDRVGADIDAFRAFSHGSSDHETVQGESFYITKVSAGDWAEKQFQQTAEDSWKHNAGLVSDAVRSLTRRHHIRLVLVAGEVRARAEVLHALADHVGEVGTVVEIEEGGRAAGASDEALWSAVQERLVEAGRAADADLANRLDEARGRGEGGATGLDEVLEALAKAQVEHLAVDLSALAEKSVRPGDHFGLPLPELAASADELPADRVVVAAAALTDAALSVLPAAMARGGGVSALLRWSDNAPAEPTDTV